MYAAMLQSKQKQPKRLTEKPEASCDEGFQQFLIGSGLLDIKIL